MNKKLNKKLLNLIALCSGLTATVALGVGGVVYSLRQEKDGGDEPVDQNVLPDSVYIIENNVLMGFTKEFLADPTPYDMCDTMQIPKRVTSINETAFVSYNESTFRYETTIPGFIKNLTFSQDSKCSSIGNLAFRSCSSLISVSLSNSLLAIGNDVFSGCSELVSIDFSNAINLRSIGSYALAYCRKLVSIDLSKCTNLSSMEWYTFYGCSSLTSINLPNSIDKIPGEAFGNCSALTSIDLSKCNKLSSINSCAFESCTSLTSVSLPESLEEIEHSAFWGCSSLSSMNFPSNLSSIDNAAFASCSSIVSISLPSNLSSLGYGVFSDCSNLSSITWDAWNGNTALDDTSFSGVCPDGGTVTVTNPSGHDSDELLQYLLDNGGLPQSWAKNVGPELPESVYDIDDNGVLLGFKSGIDLSQYDSKCDTMKIPANVTSINAEAFCANYSSTIPSFIKNLTFAENSNCLAVGRYAFAYSSLISVDLSNSKTREIYNGVFQYCSSLTSVILPNSLGMIGSDAFYLCKALTSVDFSKATMLSSINSSAFYDCDSLTSVDLSNTNLSTIGEGVFWNCINLETIIFPNSLKEIDSYAFIYCSSLTSIDLSNCVDLNVIQNESFDYCSSLTSVSFPSSLKTISTNAFGNCPWLNSITWNAWKGSTALRSDTFSGVCPDGGTVTVTNPIDDDHNSTALLDYLLNNGGLPQSWAKDVGPELPEEVYIIENNVLKGFTNEFLANPTAYDMCDTMKIPARVTSVDHWAFNVSSTSTTRIPPFITKLTFAEGSNCSTLGNSAFAYSSLTSIDLSNCHNLSQCYPAVFLNCSSLTSIDFQNCTNLSSLSSAVFDECTSLTSVKFPSSLSQLGASVFRNCSNLSNITWNAWDGNCRIGSTAFSGISSTGTIVVTNPTDDAHDSSALLEYLQTVASTCGFPKTGWTVAR